MNKLLIGFIIALLGVVAWQALRPDPHSAERQELRGRLETCVGERDTAQLANENTNKTLGGLQAKHSKLVMAMATQTAAAQESEQRYLELETEFLATEQMNKRYLDELRTRDPVAAEWLATGVDHAVACRLWPEANYCQGTLPR